MHFQERGRSLVYPLGTYRFEQDARIDVPCHSQLYKGALVADLLL